MTSSTSHPRFTWGSALTIVFIGWALFIAQFIYRANRMDRELVADTPYEQSIAYQLEMDALRRGATVSQQVLMVYTEAELTLQVPEGATHGTLLLQRPDRRAEDLQLNFSRTQMEFPVQLRRGRWRAIIQWQQDGQAYRVDRELFVP